MKTKDKSFIPVNTPLLIGNELKYVNEAIKTGWISSEGPFVNKFEQLFANNVNRKFGIAVSNGSAALEIAVKALGIGPGDEVIMPTFTIISCASAIISSGAKPVLVDSDLNNWNMVVKQIKEKITKFTKAIMVVHIYGLPVNMNPILEIANEFGLKIIEDAAEMHGQKYKNKPCGSFGNISIFSFYANKHITTGEGGMIVTDDEKLANNCKYYRNLCFQPEKRFVHEDLGWNYRFTNIQAALGLAQLERLHEIILKKRKIGALYTKLLSKVKGIQLPLEKTDYAQNIYWVYGILIKNDISFDATEAMRILRSYGIGTRPFFYPMHLQPVFKKMGLFNNERYPIAEQLYHRGFYLPSGLGLSQKQIEYIGNTVLKIFK